MSNFNNFNFLKFYKRCKIQFNISNFKPKISHQLYRKLMQNLKLFLSKLI